MPTAMEIAFIVKVLTYIATHTAQPAMLSPQAIEEIAGRIGQAEGAYIGPGFNPEPLYPLVSQWLTAETQGQWAKRQHEQAVGLSREAMDVATRASASLPEISRALADYLQRNNDPMGNAELAQTGNGIGALNAQAAAGSLGVLTEMLQLQTNDVARKSFAISQAKDHADAHYGLASISGGVEFTPEIVDPFAQ